MKKYFIILTGVFALFACQNSGKTNVENDAIHKAFLEQIKTVSVVMSHQEEDLLLTGKVTCDPNRVVSYTPLISGVVERSFFSLGDRVSKGQTMLAIRSPELSALQSALTITRRNLQSAESLFKDNLLSERELIEARSDYDKLQADLSLYGDALGNGVFAVKSPVSGYVVSSNTSSGSTVTEGETPLFTVADLSQVWVVANVYAGDLQAVREGIAVEITALAYPEEVFPGKIDALSQVFDPEEKVLHARIVMPNKELKFKPEMAVMVKLKNEKNNRLPSVPSDALIFDDNRSFVVVETNIGEYAIKEVKKHERHSQTVYITSGLTEGEKVVIKNQLLIYSELKKLPL